MRTYINVLDIVCTQISTFPSNPATCYYFSRRMSFFTVHRIAVVRVHVERKKSNPNWSKKKLNTHNTTLRYVYLVDCSLVYELQARVVLCSVNTYKYVILHHAYGKLSKFNSLGNARVCTYIYLCMPTNVRFCFTLALCYIIWTRYKMFATSM
jgi:hypothetical protein